VPPRWRRRPGARGRACALRGSGIHVARDARERWVSGVSARAEKKAKRDFEEGM